MLLASSLAIYFKKDNSLLAKLFNNMKYLFLLLVLSFNISHLYGEDEILIFLRESKANKLDTGILKLNIDLLQYKEYVIKEELSKLEPKVELSTLHRPRFKYYSNYRGDGYYIQFLMNVYSTDTSYEQCQKISDAVRRIINSGFGIFGSYLNTSDSESIERTKKFVINDAAKYFSDYGHSYNKEIAENIARKYRFKISLVKEKCRGVGTKISTKCHREKEPNWAVSCSSNLFSNSIEYSK
jgi:hypothetical protein